MTNQKRLPATFTKAAITKSGGNAYQNEIMVFLYVM